MEAVSVAGQRKHSASILSSVDRRFSARLVPRVPRYIRSTHLTLLTLVWSALVIAGDALAVGNRLWLIGVSFVVASQYLTDAIDGKLGAVRGDGLVRWGFYMDHLLDYTFLCAVLVGYALLVPAQFHWLIMVILVVAVGFMVSSFLACALEGDLGISYLRVGPVEIRVLLITLNIWLALGGRAPLARVLPIVLATSGAALFAFVARTQRRLWLADNPGPSLQGLTAASPSFNRLSTVVSRPSATLPTR
jgi:phosphatidylglycerophosphate synthase